MTSSDSVMAGELSIKKADSNYYPSPDLQQKINKGRGNKPLVVSSEAVSLG